jgi:hypothetical protein
MARSEHLPIYKKAMEIALYFEQIVRNFSRYNKYTLGAELRNKSREIACHIMKVNSPPDKREGLRELCGMVDELKVLIRLCGEAKAFYNPNSFMHSSRMVAELAMQSQGWYAYSK